jgi:NTP pyrophosphatase (non-canonical NTP hydrolase)
MADIGLNEMRDSSHRMSVEHGWWPDGEKPNIPEKLALIHSEVSEALEAYRDGWMDTRIDAASKKPEGFPSEIADVLIRIGDLCGYLGIDLALEVRLKQAYNATRAHRHGGKVC